METKQKRQRRYKLHYNLRKKGNTVQTRQRTVTKRAKEITDIEKKWISELIDIDYCVCDGMFAPDSYKDI